MSTGMLDEGGPLRCRRSKNELTWMVTKGGMPTILSHEIIAAAILGFEEQLRHIDAKIAELRGVLSGGPAEPSAASESPMRKRRKMSAAARKRIAEAQRKRWAAARKSSTPEAAAKPKRKLSAAGRRAIAAATKRRWALKRAEVARAAAAKSVKK